jgi:glutathione S-transferase
MRARMGILVSGRRVELREVVLRDKPQAMLEASPKGTVPVLVLPNGKVIEESLEIMQWALGQHDPDQWLIRNFDRLAEALALVKQTEQGESFKVNLDKYKYFNRHPEESQGDYREKAEVFLQELEDRLGTSAYVMGDEMTFVDVAIFPFIRQFAHIDREWFEKSTYSSLKKWLEQFLESDLFALIMKKYDPWKPDDEPIIFPMKKLP